MFAKFPEFKKFIQEIFQDIDGNYSSKRVVLMVALALVVIAVISNLFWGYVLVQFMYDSLIYLILGGSGIVALTERGIPFRSTTRQVVDSKVTTDTPAKE